LRNSPANHSSPKTWSSREAYLLALVCLFAGLVVGWLFRGSSPSAATSSAAVGSTAPAGSPPGMTQTLQSPESLNPVVQPMLDALKVNPKDADTLVRLGNTYFDHQFWSQAVTYYQRALEIRPNDVNVRTDLGTALYNAGFPEKAVAEFEKSLKVNPTHPNTLFNLGVVRWNGLNDAKGAIAVWEKLLETNPNYPEKQKVLDLIAKAKGQPG